MLAIFCLPRLCSARPRHRAGRVLILVLGLLGGSSLALAAELQLSFEDPQGQPVQYAVAALLPSKARDYGDRPTAMMDQSDQQFAPHVLAVRTNTLVRFPNSDNIRHHVYSFSPAKRFELRLYHGSTAEPVLFDQPGQVALGCNIHDSMLGYIYVVDSEWFAVSDADGRLSIKDLPPGDYQLQVQHPRLGADPITQTLSIAADEAHQKHLSLPALEPDPRNLEPESELERLFER